MAFPDGLIFHAPYWYNLDGSGPVIPSGQGVAPGVGAVGYYVENDVTVANQLPLTTNVALNVASLTLPAGDWDIEGTIVYNGNALTTVTYTVAAISKNTGAIELPKYGNVDVRITAVPAINCQISAPMRREIFTNPTTFYLIALSNFATNVMNVYGNLRARLRA